MKQVLFLLLLALWGCSSEEVVKHPTVDNKYNASQPRTLSGFTPESGGIGDKLIVKGNFGTDISKMKVIFDNNKEARILSTDGASIYCLVPKQGAGDNSIKVMVGDEELTTDKTFAYIQNQKVSTICGMFNKDGYVNGNIYDAMFSVVVGINLVANDNIMAVETHKKRVRLISQEDNQVVTVMDGLCTGKPAVNEARDIIYCVELYRNSGKVYRLRRDNSWAPELIRGNIAELATGEQWSCTLDDTEKYLYVRNHMGVLIRLSLEEKADDGQLKVEKLIDEKTYISGSTLNFLVYSKVDKCFYASEAFNHNILKIWQEGGVWKQEIFAGMTSPGLQNGDRLEAKFNVPFGLTVDSEGNIYVADSSNNAIRKISHYDPVSKSGGRVTTVAGGTKSTDKEVDGNPLESTFFIPHDVAADSEDNLYIAGGDGKNVRKLAIE